MIKETLHKNEAVLPSSRETDALREYFPACFKEDGSFDIERFKEFLSNKMTVTHEGYELKFLGKNYARLLASLDTTTVIVPNEAYNSELENAKSENTYISGDNLDALKHLLKSYSRKVKCIYIDPPYNTGSDGFVHNDSFDFSIEELSEKLSIGEEQAQRVIDLTKRGSASHSAWLMFMYPRLLLARDLLTDDGVIFISIDDNEQSNLKLLCDDVFGEENCIAQIIVQSNKRGQTYKQLAKTHEYILVYTRNVNGQINELTKEIGSFTMSDMISEFSERELRNRNPKYGRFNRPNLFYPVFVNVSHVDDNGYCPISLVGNEKFSTEVLPFNSEGAESCWRWGTTKFAANNNEDTQFSNIAARKKSTGEYGIYEKYRKTTYKAKTIWFNEFIANELIDEDDDIWDETGVITEQGSGELGDYEMGDVFDFPKPTYLIRKILSLGSASDSICVDFFSGSATTSEAVMQLNATSEGKSKRRFIAIQLPEDLDYKLEMASTMLYSANPWCYGIGLHKHPEFMEHLAQIDPMAKKAVEWWDNHSRGYLIAAKVPFYDAQYDTFCYNSQEKQDRDKTSGYSGAKAKLLRNALRVTFEQSPSDVYLFIKRESNVDFNQVIDVQEHNLR